MAAAHEDDEGGVVYLGAGTFVLTQPLSIAGSNVVIRGAGVRPSCGAGGMQA